jgi:hypothetical protein
LAAKALAMPCRCGRTVAGGAIGREALDARAVAIGDAGDVPRPSTCRAAAPGPMPVGRRIKPGKPGERSTARRWMPPTLLDVPRRVLSWPAQTDGVFWDRE